MHKRAQVVLMMCLTLASVDVMAQSSGQVVRRDQTVTLHGLITDAQGEPLVGATVKEVGGKTGVVADVEGKFTIKTAVGKKLLVDYLGMKQQEVKVTGNDDVTIRLQPSDVALNEVVVTGYRTVNTRVFVGSASHISAKDFASAPQADFSRLLEGRAPGLNISSVSSTFGSAPKVNIRGGGSINGSVQPLWVVDGSVIDDIVSLNNEQLTSGDAITLIGSTIAGLNPADVESIEVLKDASATSLYGARGMNGVIVVTTKSGKRNAGFHAAYNFTSFMRMKPSYAQYDMLNSAETMDIYKEMANKGYFPMEEALYGRRGGIYTEMYEAINHYDKTGFGLPNTTTAKDAFLNRAALYNTDWFDQIYRMTPTQNHSLSLSYGGKKNTLYASLSFYKDAGETIADRVERFTANVKNTYYISDKLKTIVGLQANFRNQYAPGTFPKIKNIEAGDYKRNFDINPFAYALGSSRTLRPYNDAGEYEYYRNDWAPFNIMEEYDQNRMNVKMNDFRVFLQAEWSPVKDLHLQALFNTRQAMTSIAHTIGERSNVIGAYRANGNAIFRENNIYLYNDVKDPVNPAKIGLPMGGIYNKTSRTLQSYLARFSADYGHSFGDHHLKAFGFAEFKMTNSDNDFFKGYGINFDRANSVATNPYIFDKLLEEGVDYFGLQHTYDRGIALSGSLTYSYRSKYILNLVGNYEGSNISGTGSRVRWLPTWNVGGKWNIDEEKFFEPLQKVWNRLSMRLSYGLVAKMNPAAINSLAVYRSATTFRPSVDDREHAIYLKNLENRDLTWEKMYELNLGFDMGFLNDRITTSVDLYHRNSFDLIDLIRTPGIGGEYEKWANFGDMRTMGVDWTVQTKNIKSKDFDWTTTLNFSVYDQKITRLINNPSTFDLVSGTGRGNLEGFPRGALYSFKFTGLTDRGLPTFYFGDLPNNSGKLFNIDGANFYDVKYNKSYLVYSGPMDANVMTGLSNSLRYKNWQLSFFIVAQLGNKVRIMPTFDPEYEDLNVFTTKYLHRWMVKGDEAHTNVPTIPGTDLIKLIGQDNIERAYNTYNYSDLSIVNGGFVRMKNISLTYMLPQRTCRSLGITSAAINGQLQNPFLIYSDRNLHGRDPEFVNAGGVASPILRTYSLSLNITF